MWPSVPQCCAGGRARSPASRRHRGSRRSASFTGHIVIQFDWFRILAKIVNRRPNKMASRLDHCVISWSEMLTSSPWSQKWSLLVFSQHWVCHKFGKVWLTTFPSEVNLDYFHWYCPASSGPELQKVLKKNWDNFELRKISTKNLCKDAQKHAKICKGMTKLCKNAQNCEKNCVQNPKISTARKN